MDKKEILSTESPEYTKACAEMEQAGYVKKENIMSVTYVNSMGILSPIPLMVIFAVIYYFRWDHESMSFNGLAVALGLIGSIVVHELLHGIGWSPFCGGFKNIKFGITKGMPYCHCKKPLLRNQYIIGGILPLLVLGILTFLISLIVASPAIFILAEFNILIAGGDILIFLKALKIKSSACILDHPKLAGFVAFEQF